MVKLINPVCWMEQLQAVTSLGVSDHTQSHMVSQHVSTRQQVSALPSTDNQASNTHQGRANKRPAFPKRTKQPTPFHLSLHALTQCHLLDDFSIEHRDPALARVHLLL